MHRDVKPFNVLIDPNTRKLKLIDWGLAEFYFPERENNCKVGSMYYKAPELYFNNPNYDYRVDIWPVGLILAGMVPLSLGRSSTRRLSWLVTTALTRY